MGAAETIAAFLLALVRAAPDAIAAFQAHHAEIKKIDPGRRKSIDDAIDAELKKADG